jgi:tetratricopeptide (TPR) repeat protein
MSRSGKQKSYEVYFFIPALVIFVLFMYANTTGNEYLWGFNFLKFFPAPFRLLSVAIALILFLPKVSRLLTRGTLKLSLSINERRLFRIIFQVVFSLVFLFLFLYFSSKTTLLGDGTLRKNQIAGGDLWLPFELLDFLIHALLYKYVFSPLAYSSVTCYRIVSIVCGLFFIDGLLRLAFYLDREKGFLYFLLLFSSGVTVLFFGYVESYSIAAALLPYVILAALKTLDNKTGPAGFIVLYILLALVHLVPAFILGVGVILTIYLHHRGERPVYRKLSFYLAGIIALAVIAGYALSFGGVEIFKKSLLPLLPVTKGGQGILTVNHFLNILNWLFLSAPGFLVLLVPLLKKKEASGEVYFPRIFVFGWIAVAAGLFMFFYTPQLGGPRDWDIFSMAAFFTLIAAVVIYAEKFKKGVSSFVWPVIFLAFMSTFSFALINSIPSKSADRFEEIIQVARFKSLFKDYAHLLSYYDTQPDLKSRRGLYEKKLLEEAETVDDSVYALRKISQLYYQDHNYEKALTSIFQALLVDSLDFQSHLLLVRYSQSFGNADNKRMVADMLVRHFPDKPHARMNAGILYSLTDDFQLADENFRRAYELDSSDFKIVSNYATFKIKRQDYENGLALLNRANELEPDNFFVNYNLSVVYRNLKRPEEANEYLEKAGKTATTKDEKDLVNEQKIKYGL